MFKKILNVFRIPDLRTKLLFTIAMLCVYRIGSYVPLPGVNAPAIRVEMSQGGDQSAFGMLSNFMSVFSGGDLSQGTIFGLGIMPYISASIILQLLGTVMPALEKLRKEGEPGVRKINEWTRYITVGVCLFQAILYMAHFNSVGAQKHLYTAAQTQGDYHGMFILLSVVVLTAGSVFLMWLGEQIEAYGIGNGVSLIITAGIVARMPAAVQDLLKGVMTPDTKRMGWSFEFIKSFIKDLFSFNASGQNVSLTTIIFLLACFIFVVGASIYLTQAQRRITVQQAKHMRGRRVYGGAKQYLPLRVNHAGVMPIIFASTLVSLPVMGLVKVRDMYPNGWFGSTLGIVAQTFQMGGYMYELTFCGMIIFFSYFWNTVQFQPKEMANQLRDYGSFVMGIRPGKWTADYLEAVMERITYVGAAFLCIIAIIPSVVGNSMLDKLPPMEAQNITQFLGGTALLIVISVMLDFVNRIEANLVMRNYSGFLDDEGGGSTAKIKRPKPRSPDEQVRPAAYDAGHPRGIPT